MSIFPHIIHLTEVVRQNEVDFVDFLGRLAEGTCTAEDEKFVSENFSKTFDTKDFGMEFIPKIYSTNYQCFMENLEQLEEITSGVVISLKSVDVGAKAVLKRCIAEKTIFLKLSSKV